MITDLPNLLTLSRIIAIPVLVLLVALCHPATDAAACVLFILAGITDYFDGHLARSRQLQSDLGRMLDPIADKLLVGASLMVLAGTDRMVFGALWPAIVILCREILVSGLREYLATTKVSLPVTRLAKWKTGFQMTAIGFLLAGDSTAGLIGLPALPIGLTGSVLLWIAAILTLITGWDYVLTGLRHVEQAPRGARTGSR
ncbi:CDP-diacylglycerol--glycerol-3-phosphate 3-phosphatidyltransferase [Acetobacter sp. AN02]|uniref:CDP-diacylglycerol--glycerol-3-phosphate 3-phosphatidyltransferase n=1 Tax=Acetobacter sp. AN02 TaxID=2894186 RepID=UPI002434512B|nr:CDP-diacylglycerol--glycerol-3-phosphate 3-phosphatidyltransferase [Acetobacter sp. AN02]MDG6094388.1 CDP-diacylglycerol--glycerol-3-phosphate 3-phosphatidyltransferase [Acetobacter sp. AN02]